MGRDILVFPKSGDQLNELLGQGTVRCRAPSLAPVGPGPAAILNRSGARNDGDEPICPDQLVHRVQNCLLPSPALHSQSHPS
jgi:hypothetical protein